MKDRYIESTAVSSLDDKITRLVTRVAKKELGGGSMVVAVQNDAGEVYRIITPQGMGAYLDIVQGLAKLGLTDLLEHDLSHKQYDSLFVFK